MNSFGNGDYLEKLGMLSSGLASIETGLQELRQSAGIPSSPGFAKIDVSSPVKEALAKIDKGRGDLKRGAGALREVVEALEGRLVAMEGLWRREAQSNRIH